MSWQRRGTEVGSWVLSSSAGPEARLCGQGAGPPAAPHIPMHAHTQLHTHIHAHMHAHAKPACPIPPKEPWDEAPGTSPDPVCSIITQTPIPCAGMEPVLGATAPGSRGQWYQQLNQPRTGRTPRQEDNRAAPQ